LARINIFTPQKVTTAVDKLTIKISVPKERIVTKAAIPFLNFKFLNITENYCVGVIKLNTKVFVLVADNSGFSELYCIDISIFMAVVLERTS